MVRTFVFDRRTFFGPRSTCSWRVTTYVGKPSAIGQPTRPTQPFILPRSINWVVKLYRMCAASFGWCNLVNAYGVKSGWSCGWQVKLCDPVNTCHFVALRDCLGRKNALYKYLILYFLLYFEIIWSKPCGPRVSQINYRPISRYSSNSPSLSIFS